MSMKPKEKWEQEEITKEWSEFKQFKDPVYGYIPVSRPYVKYLIDTQMMQRIKGVAQTGLRPVFSSATHDRFSHSLGVYKFAMAMYDSFEEKLLIDVQYLFEKWGTASIIAEKLHSVSCTNQAIRKRPEQAKMKRKRSLSLFCKFNVRTDI